MNTQRIRLIKDKFACKSMFLLTVFSGMIVFLIASGLYYRSKPILALKPLKEILFSDAWHPLKGDFGLFPFITGTLWVTCVAVMIAIPLCILTAIYISEYSNKKLRELATPLVDLLAGIPSVVYGMWGVLVVVPFVKNIVAPLSGTLSTGYSVLTGGIVLAVMISPIIIHVSAEVLRSVPSEIREASLALGATKWQTIKHVVIRRAMPGVTAAVVLGLSRAFGETMAVLMVVGNVPRVPRSVLDPAYPLPALIANNYGEMMSIPLYDSVLLLASLILLAVVLFFNIISRSFLVKVEKDIG